MEFKDKIKEDKIRQTPFDLGRADLLCFFCPHLQQQNSDISHKMDSFVGRSRKVKVRWLDSMDVSGKTEWMDEIGSGSYLQ